MWHEQVRELAQAVMAQRTEVEVFLVSSLQLVSAHCCGHSVPSALPIQPRCLQ